MNSRLQRRTGRVRNESMRLLIIACLVTALQASTCYAQMGGRGGSGFGGSVFGGTGFGGLGGPPGRDRNSALVLTSGQVLIGSVDVAPSGYLIKKEDHTEEVIPRESVRVVGKSLHHCYEKLRDSVAPNNSEGHVTLGKWCLQEQLTDDARAEFQAALRIDPGRSDARKLMQALEEFAAAKGESKQESSPEPAMRRDVGLAGLTQESTSHFVQRVQPLLLSRCGNAACHGSGSSQEFQLLPVSRTSSGGRASSSTNLKAVLALVDTRSPDNSSLVKILEQPSHWRKYAGTTVAEQNAEIRDWVFAVADHAHPERRVTISKEEPSELPESRLKANSSAPRQLRKAMDAR